MGTRLKGMKRHLPYGISSCYLPPDTVERVYGLCPQGFFWQRKKIAKREI